jgi:hypothetical protein
MVLKKTRKSRKIKGGVKTYCYGAKKVRIPGTSYFKVGRSISGYCLSGENKSYCDDDFDLNTELLDKNPNSIELINSFCSGDRNDPKFSKTSEQSEPIQGGKKSRKSRKIKGGVKWCERIINKKYQGEKEYNKRFLCFPGETAFDCNDGIIPDNENLSNHYKSGDCKVKGGKRNKSKKNKK